MACYSRPKLIFSGLPDRNSIQLNLPPSYQRARQRNREPEHTIRAKKMLLRGGNDARKSIRRLGKIRDYAFGGDALLYPPSQLMKRPAGIAWLAVLWSIGVIILIIRSLNLLIGDLGYFPLLSDPNVPEWYRFGLPAEMVLSIFVILVGFLALYVVYGLYTAKSWSYIPALATPLFALVLNVAETFLYASAPSEAEMGYTVAASFIIALISSFWLLVVWFYVPKLHVKQYLKLAPPPAPVPVPPTAILPVPPPPEPVAITEEKRFCRYCGAEQKSDAVFCEKCGKKIG